MSDEDDASFGLRQALPVAPIPDDFDPTIAPTSGEEYLQHVVYEAKNFGPYFIATNLGSDITDSQCDPKVIKTKAAIGPSHLAPTEEWRLQQIEKFEELRNNMHRRRMNCPDSTAPELDAEAPLEECRVFLDAHKPLVPLLISLRQGQLERLLSASLHLINTSALTVERGAWIYAIAANLEHPLSREACGDLRDIARKCAYFRQKKVDSEDQELTLYNLIITLVVDYFKQLDLCDPI